ncbi:MAG: GNAT family N-acetyltransferase [Blastococcus sp.]|nr:GNAT family N-acetyltransferase [Blastococcus sp.]
MIASGTDPAMEAVVLRDLAGFDALAGEWDELWRRCPAATPFQTHAWLSSWARAYVRGGRVVVVVVRSGGRLVAGAALHRVRRGPVPVLVPLGGRISDFTDVLLDPDVPAAAGRLATELAGLRGAVLLDLPEVLPGAMAEALATSWPGTVHRMPASVSVEIPADDLATTLARLPSRTASTLRRKLRRIEKSGIERAEVAAHDVPRAVAYLLGLHEAQWAGRGGNPEHLRERFRQHLTEAVSRMVDRGQAVVVEYRLDGRLVSSQIDLVDSGRLSYYLAGVSPELRELIDTAVLIVRGDLELAGRLGSSRYSMLRGREDYKFRWRPDEVQATRLLLGRSRGPAAGYVAAAELRVVAVRVAKAGRTRARAWQESRTG